LAFTVAVAVTDESNNPIPDAKILVSPDSEFEGSSDDSGQLRAWITDKRGHVLVEGLTVRPRSVGATHEQFVPSAIALNHDPSQRNLTAKIVMAKAVILQGIVTRGALPEKRVSVSVVSVSPAENGGEIHRLWSKAQTDDAGKFELRNVPSGRFSIACSTGEMSFRQPIVVTSAPVQFIEIAIPSRATDKSLARITGTVTIDGRPALVVMAHLDVESETGSYRLNAPVSYRERNPEQLFEFNDVMPGSATLRIDVVDESTLGLNRILDFEIVPGAEINQDIAFVSRAPLTVRVDGPQNAHARVEVVRTGQTQASRNCDAGEEVEIRGLEAGNYTIILLTAKQGDQQWRPIQETVVELKEDIPTRVELTIDGGAA
jgi:hypothetical protein